MDQVNKIQIKIKGGRQYVIGRLYKKQQLNVREIGILNGGYCEEFIHVEVEEKSRQIKYDTTGCIPLRQRLQGMISRQEFLGMVREILALNQDMEKTVCICKIYYGITARFTAKHCRGTS